jgi:hypothetical protein
MRPRVVLGLHFRSVSIPPFQCSTTTHNTLGYHLFTGSLSEYQARGEAADLNDVGDMDMPS